MSYRYTLIASAVSAAMLAACSSESTVVDPAPQPSGRQLQSLGNSEAFYSALRKGLKGQAADSSREEGYTDGGDSVAQDSDASAPENSSDSSSAQGDSGAEVSGTNVQEQGVDEQDWVKTSADGSTLFVLKRGYEDVHVDGVASLDDTGGSSAPNMAADAMLASDPFYNPPGKTTLRVLSLDASTPDATSVLELDVDLSGRYAEGFYLYEKQDAASAFISSSGQNYWAHWSEPTAFANQDSLIAQVDVSDPAQASVIDSLTLDGQIVSSRRIGNHLFFAARHYPALPGEAPWTQSREQWEALVDSADLSTLLPHYTQATTGERKAMIDPANCFVTEPRGGNEYYSPDIVTLGVFNLDTLQLSDSECYLGSTETLYASPNAVFLATTQYDYQQGPVDENGREIDVESGEFTAGSVWYDPRIDTDLHQFDISGGQLSYAGSGTVDGHLGWNPLRKPFRMSEKDGYLRVATINDKQGPGNSPILVSVFKSDGAGNLAKVSSLPNAAQPGLIGKPGEQLYASRFLGDRGYLVTFRQTDPLYILDLADPNNPSVIGELEIEGYSDYLQPIGEDYLLGIGKDAYPAEASEGGDGRGALVQGVKLSLFNISNPSQPVEVQSVLIGERGTYAQALSDHRAIAIQPATDDHPMRVSFGITVHGRRDAQKPASIEAARVYQPFSYSGLHGFDIKVGTDAGIVPRGELVVTPETGGAEPSFYHYQTDNRSVLVNDSVFYIHGGAVFAAPWDDLANPTAAR